MLTVLLRRLRGWDAFDPADARTHRGETMHVDSLCDRYLAILGLPARRPSVDALAELTAAHLERVPFENISKLYFRHDPSRRGVWDLGRFLDGIERYRFGGTCYTSAGHFHALLRRLGYEVTLRGADMASPNVHIVNVATIAGRPYLVDVGYGAPLVEPFSLDGAGEREIVWGPYRYVLRPRGRDGRPVLDMYRNGTRTHGYTVNPAPRRIEDFADVIAESFSDRATFMHALLLARFGRRRGVVLRNTSLTIRDGETWRHSEVSRDALPDVIHREFGMALGIVRRALDGVELNRQP